MDIKQAKDIFHWLYANTDGYRISIEARKKLSYYYIADTYGEVEFDSFYQILSLAQPKPNEVFYDLGSGIGKPSLVAYLCFNFSKIIGIEKLEGLWQTSKNILERLQKHYLELCKTKSNSQIDFIQGNFLDLDFSDGDVIFINSYTFFYYQIYDRLFINRLKKLKKGTKIITTVMPITLPIFNIKKLGRFKFSWGEEDVLIHSVFY